MFVSPFSTPMGYTMPDGKGIYVKPTSDAAPDGWGEPRLDTSTTPYTPIVPGTPGGPLERVLIRKKSSGLKAAPTKYFQKAGNITWWGDLRYANKPAKGKRVLSYNGPKLRYFREIDFNYGDDPSHNEIYTLGNYAAIAPGPVTGACMRKMNFYNPATDKTTEEWFIICATYMGGMDRFWKKRFNGVKTPFNMSDEVREHEMKLYDVLERPYGWIPMGDYPRVGNSFPPETPWFFNKSGTAAACMRRKPYAHNNGYESVTEDVFDRYKATVGEDLVTVVNNGNLPPMTYVEKYVKTHPDVYVSTDAENYDHEWQEDHIKVSIDMNGEQYVMCDYVDDVLYYGKIRYRIMRRQEEYFTIGIDPTPYLNGSGQNISNQGQLWGPLPYPPGYVPAPADHYWNWWISLDENARLYYGPEGNDETNFIDLHFYDSGTSEEWAGLPRQANNPILYYYRFVDRYARGLLDIRDMIFMAHDYTRYGLYQNGGDVANRTEKFEETLYTDANTSGKKYRTINKSSSGVVGIGWTRPQMLSWPQTFNNTLTRYTYSGKWPTDNHQGELQVPGNKTFYQNDVVGDMSIDWPTIPELIYGDKNKCKGNGVLSDQSFAALSVEVPDVENEGKYVVISDMYPAADLKAIVGFGEKFYPIGAC